MEKYAVYALIGLSFIFLCTVLGALAACLFGNKTLENSGGLFSGFSAGVMISASVWSLLIPSIEQTHYGGFMKVLPTVFGAVFGSGLMFLLCVLLPENEDSSFKKVFVAITCHNIPEGLAVGFAFGMAGITGAGVASAMGLAYGIGIQNFPEGTAISLPARKIMNRKRAFSMGALSGSVEPVAGIIGFFTAKFVGAFLPCIMAFSAGAMIYTVFSDLIPFGESVNKNKLAVGFVFGMLLMMSLDVVLG